MFEINGEYWGIFIVSPNHHSLRRSDGSFTIGVCDNNEKRIYISDGLEPLLMKKVLAHEITHAATFSYGVNLSLSQEELLADLIATYGQEIICIANKIFHRITE